MKGIGYILGFLMLWLVACQQHEGIDSLEEPVELTFKLKLPNNGSRGNVTDFPNDPSNWTQSDKLIDGRYLYVVSVYLVDEASKTIVAKKENITVSDQATEVVVNFSRDPEGKLKRGVHTLMAVANYEKCIIGTNEYLSGLIEDWKSATYDELMNNKIQATDQYISPKNIVQPLSLMKEIELHAGHNEVEGELIRTFARLRMEVKNNSGSFPLKVESLVFSDNFSQKQAYVFDDGTNRKYLNETLGQPVASSQDALTPFALDNGASFKTINAQASSVLFDAYLLESNSGEGNYKYTLKLKYDDVTTTSDSYASTGNDITSTGNLAYNNNESNYYLIYRKVNNTNYYLSAGSDNKVETATLASLNNLGKHVVWQLIKSNNSYKIKNVSTDAFMQKLENNVNLGNEEVLFTLSDRSNAIRLSNNSKYITINNSGTVGVGNAYSNNTFYFKKVTKTTTTQTSQTIPHEEEIVLTTIDPITQQASRVKAIRRNDFINLLITVSYNPVAGKFEFNVENWNTGGGNVEFN